jgi:membrane protein DedA with SNARE-associated domain
MQNRYKSKVVWATTAMLLGLILKNQFDIEITAYDKYIEMILFVLVELGILNNPENKEGF